VGFAMDKLLVVGSTSSSSIGSTSTAGQLVDTDIDHASCIGCGSSVISAESSSLRSFFTNLQPPAHPLPVLYHQDFRRHITQLTGTFEVHQEGPERVHSIFVKLMEEAVKGKFVEMLMYDNDIPLATKEDLMQVHTKGYVDFLINLCARYEAFVGGTYDDEVMRFSPIVVSRLASEEEKGSYFAAERHLTSATRFSNGSYAAAMRAAGSVKRAVDIVMGTESPQKRAFCLVRPPGHHAGPEGYDPVAGGCGFCIINNVMVGAAHARAIKPNCRVAIVDIDVHHGNGTQMIIERTYKGEPVLYCSLHLLDKTPGDPDQDFFPGTGEEQDDEQFLNVPITPLWKKNSEFPDKSVIPIRPVPVPSSTPPIIPAVASFSCPQSDLGSKRKSPGKPGASSKKPRVSNSDSPAFNWKPLPRPVPQSGGNSGRVAWRRAMEQRVIPKLQSFKADILFISAGFDGAFEDEGCSQDGMSGLDLTDADFAWATKLMAGSGGAKTVVSVLEGGYGRWCGFQDRYDVTPLVTCCLAHIASLVENDK